MMDTIQKPGNAEFLEDFRPLTLANLSRELFQERRKPVLFCTGVIIYRMVGISVLAG